MPYVGNDYDNKPKKYCLFGNIKKYGPFNLYYFY